VRILQVARQFYPSVAGVENVVENLAGHLLQRGHQCDVVTLDRCFYAPERKLPAYEQIRGINVHRIPFWGRQRFFVAPGVLKYARDYDLVHIHNVDFFIDFLALTKAYHRRPLVLSTQGGFFHTQKAAVIKQLYFSTITRLSLRAADVVIAVSDHDRELFAPVSDRIIQISNGIDFSGVADVHKRIERGLLVYVGRLVSNKRLDHLLRAVALACRQRSDLHLVAIGVDYEGIQENLETLATELGIAERVTFTGLVSHEELRDYLARAHLFCSASEYESFGISVLEAMSTGTVPVVNRIKPFQAIISHGKNGFLADLANAHESAKILDHALGLDDETLREMGSQARVEAAEYSWERIVPQLEAIYARLCKGAR
jgi:alpha-1,3-mannosyltransferase